MHYAVMDEKMKSALMKRPTLLIKQACMSMGLISAVAALRLAVCYWGLGWLSEPRETSNARSRCCCCCCADADADAALPSMMQPLLRG